MKSLMFVFALLVGYVWFAGLLERPVVWVVTGNLVLLMVPYFLLFKTLHLSRGLPDG